MRTYQIAYHVGGDVTGEAIVSQLPLSFLGGVNSETGKIIDSHNPLCGQSMEGKILIYPFSKGSTGDCMRLWRTCFNGKGPIAIINTTPDPIHVEDHSITTAGTQKLFLGRDDADLIRGKRILIMDDVISTGGSLKAMEALVQEAGGVVTGKVAVLAEGDAADRTDIKFLKKLPLFNADGTVKD